jgi:hypothetical protein
MDSLVEINLDRTGFMGTACLNRKDWRRVSVAFNPFGDAGVRLLLSSFGSVEVLNLRGTRVTAAVMDAIGDVSQKMRALDLSVNPLGDAGVASFFRLQFPLMESLALCNTLVTTVGIQAYMPRLAMLKHVDLRWNPIQPEVFRFYTGMDFAGCPTALVGGVPKMTAKRAA